MDDEVVHSGIFKIAMTNCSPKHVKINNKMWVCSNHMMKRTYVPYTVLQPFKL